MFPDKLIELRKKNNLTQEQLAKKMNMVKQTIGSWEQGRTEPSIESINKLAKILNTTTDFLLGNEKKENYETKNNLEQTFEETIEELKQEETLMFMKNGDIDEESARLVKLAMKNAIRMVGEMNKNKNKE